jgi:hypothetical protein
MPTECSLDFFGFGPVEGRAVVAAFDAGAITSDAGALLLGATDHTIRMMDRLAACFHDVRCPELIEHQVVTLVGQRVFSIALGYEDLNDHDELGHDPMLAVLSGKLAARSFWRALSAPRTGPGFLCKIGEGPARVRVTYWPAPASKQARFVVLPLFPSCYFVPEKAAQAPNFSAKSWIVAQACASCFYRKLPCFLEKKQTWPNNRPAAQFAK